MSENIFPSATMERIERRKQIAAKILELFEAEELSISDCEMTLLAAKDMLKECYVLIKKPATAGLLQANE